MYEDALGPLGEKVIYMDTNSVIYVSPTESPLISMDTTGEMGLWTNEAKSGDHFVEFVSLGPKLYGQFSFHAKYTVEANDFSFTMPTLENSILTLSNNR